MTGYHQPDPAPEDDDGPGPRHYPWPIAAWNPAETMRENFDRTYPGGWARYLRDALTNGPVCPTCSATGFFYVAERTHPNHCIECAAELDRAENGWTPQNSVD